MNQTLNEGQGYATRPISGLYGSLFLQEVVKKDFSLFDPRDLE